MPPGLHHNNIRTPDRTLDVLVVGAGFSGLYQLIKLRDAGFNVHIFEAGSNLGGTWHWNCYPGARVDSDFFIYQYSHEDLWKGYTWTERFPGREELVSYFDYVDKKLGLKKDISFNTRVTGAHFDQGVDRWVVETQNGWTVRPRFLVLCTGFASKPLFPDIKGLSSFQGVMHHTALWPMDDSVVLSGKKVGVIGTGASGVQVIQEAGPVASHLTVFQRTPNLALAMYQRKLTSSEQDKMKEEMYPVIFRRCRQTYAGFHFNPDSRNVFDFTPEERYLHFDEMWRKGGLIFVSSARDIRTNDRASEEAYKFWRKKVLARLVDPEMQRKLAPEKAPHPFGVKRHSLEQNYYDVFNQPNVTLVDLQENPISEVTPKGVKTQDGVEHEFDVLVLATGFDSITGSIAQIDIRGTDGRLVRDKWKEGLKTYLGLTTASCPNMFFPYGPQGPTAHCNGPTCSEVQGEWIVSCVSYMREHRMTRIEATRAAESEWTQHVYELFSRGLWGKAKSWYTGANVPGKRIEPLNFTGGMPHYNELCNESAENGYSGFVLSRKLPYAIEDGAKTNAIASTLKPVTSRWHRVDGIGVMNV